MVSLRLFNPDTSRDVSELSTVSEFFDLWYLGQLSEGGRKPPSTATIRRRREALAWWPKLMGTPSRPNGPLLCEITAEKLREFESKLAKSSYSRGTLIKPLSEASQKTVLRELQIVLAAAGPRQGRLIRAGLIDRPAWIAVEPAALFPKGNWTLDEARRIVSAISLLPPASKRHPTLTPGRWQQLWRAYIALLFFTGHRATTYRFLCRHMLVEAMPGQWWLQIPHSVKTRKSVRLACHPRLLSELQATIAMFESDKLIPFPIVYSAIARNFAALQALAGLPRPRQFTLHAWRRLNAESVANTGFAMAEKLAQSSLGHSSVSVTRQSYTAALDSALLLLPDIFD